MDSALQKLVDLDNATVFETSDDGAVKVLATRGAVAESDLPALPALFASADDAFKNGVLINGTRFEVFKYFNEQDPSLVYGRTEEEDKEGGVGFCVLRKGSNKFMVATYSIPILSAKAVPQMVAFSKAHM